MHNTTSKMSVTLKKALLEQVLMELRAHLSYRNLAFYCYRYNWYNFSRWFETHAKEEQEHANRLIAFLQENRQDIEISTVYLEALNLESVEDCFKIAYEEEQKVTIAILKLYDLAQKEGFREAEIFLDWFVTEQREEEFITQTMLEQVQTFENNRAHLLLFDQQLKIKTN